MSRAKPFAVNDADAGVATQFTLADEIMQRVFGFRYGHAMQIDLVLHTEIPACEFAHGSTADGWSAKSKAFTCAGLGLVNIRFETLSQDLFFVLPGKSGCRANLWARLRRFFRLR